MKVSPCKIHDQSKVRSKRKYLKLLFLALKELDPDEMSGVMQYIPKEDGNFKVENAMSFVPAHMQPSHNKKGKIWNPKII